MIQKQERRKKNPQDTQSKGKKECFCRCHCPLKEEHNCKYAHYTQDCQHCQPHPSQAEKKKEIKAMTVGEIIEALSKFPKDKIVGIPVVDHSGFGGTPTVPITSIGTGFDWDSGRCFINTTPNKLKVLKVETKRYKKWLNIL